MKKSLIWMIVIAVASGTVSCSYDKSWIVKGSSENRLPPVEYRIGPEDVLEIQVWKNAELTKVVSVRPDGRISFPLIGEVAAAGLTPVALSEEIEKRLSRFQAAPEVSVMVQEVNSYAVYVLGEVTHPGRFKLKSYITLFQAVSLAGGFTPFASKNNIKVFHRGFQEDLGIVFTDLYKDAASGEDPSKNIFLMPGDTVFVP